MKENIVYFGSGYFGLKTLEIFVKNDFIPDLIVTVVSDKEKVLKISKRLKITSFKNLKSNGVKEKLRAVSPSLFILASYGKILPKEISDIPKFGTLNLHPSLLPELRGPSPIQTAILEGKEETGATIFLIDEKIDHGPILGQIKIEIKEEDDYLSLNNKLAEIGTGLFLELIPKWLTGRLKPVEQDHAKATYTRIFRKEDGRINWEEPAETVFRKIRALNPWPGTYTFFTDKNGRQKMLKILKVGHYADLTVQTKPAEVVFKDKKLFVGAKNNLLELKEVQPEGKNSMSGEAFYRGHQYLKNFF